MQYTQYLLNLYIEAITVLRSTLRNILGSFFLISMIYAHLYKRLIKTAGYYKGESVSVTFANILHIQWVTFSVLRTSLAPHNPQ